MSRKDYVKLAAVLKDARSILAASPSDAGVQVLITITNGIVDVLSADNPRFDRRRFIDAIWPLDENVTTGGVLADGTVEVTS